MEINKTRILSGLMAVSAKRAAPTVPISTAPTRSKRMAPTTVTTQYEPKENRPIFTFGKKSTAAIIAKQVATAIKIEGSILFPFQSKLCIKKRHFLAHPPILAQVFLFVNKIPKIFCFIFINKSTFLTPLNRIFTNPSIVYVTMKKTP